MTTPQPNENHRPLLPYYVYILMDPRNDEAFYCGKGQGNRAQQHIEEALSKIKNDETLTTSKQQRLGEILGEGRTPKALVIGRYETEAEALAVEATAIRWFYGRDQLTNAIEGHGADTIREKANHNALEGIDMPIRINVRDGSFTNHKLEGLAQAGAFDDLQDLQQHLQQENFAVRDFSAPDDRAFDPGASNGLLGLFVRAGSVDFMVTRTANPVWRLSIGNTMQSRTQDALQQLQAIREIMGANYSAGEPKNNEVKGQGRYRDFQKRPEFAAGQIDNLVALLRELKACGPAN